MQAQSPPSQAGLDPPHKFRRGLRLVRIPLYVNRKGFVFPLTPTLWQFCRAVLSFSFTMESHDLDEYLASAKAIAREAGEVCISVERLPLTLIN